MTNQVIKVPDLGGADSVEVIEISVAVGDQLACEDTIVVLESDKATMEVPCPMEGAVLAILVKEGDNLSEGDPILELGVEAEPKSPSPEVSESPAEQVTPETSREEVVTETAAIASVKDIVVPDLGTDGEVDVIEVLVAVGDQVEEGDNILVLETDKATVEMPVSFGGSIEAFNVSEGSRIKQGQVIGTIKTTEPVAAEVAKSPTEPPQKTRGVSKPPIQAQKPPVVEQSTVESSSNTSVYAGPAVRQLARKLGVDLTQVKGTGQRNRIVKEDVEAFVKQSLKAGQSSSIQGSGIPAIPAVDFSQFGEVSEIPLTKIQKITATNMSRSWLNAPHVTQFDDADITDMESFRQELKKEGQKRDIKLTPLAFLLLASAKALREHPAFNRSLSHDGQNFIQKHYVNIGIAVDTPKGLMVPVLKNADQKGLWDLADEANKLAAKARDGKLTSNDMQGGCFTISSLGAIGGTGFTPIVNTPEVAILGVSKSAMKPVWDGKNFVPRLMLPLGLSYDHRALNGVDAGKFLTSLVALLSDTRRLAL